MTDLSYYERNKEEIKRKNREYYWKHKQDVKSYYQLYYESNKCKIQAMRKMNPLRTEWFREYYISTKDGGGFKHKKNSQIPNTNVNNFSKQVDKIIVSFN